MGDPGFFCSPGRLVYGPGSRHGLAALLLRMRIGRVAFITDPFFGAAGAAGDTLAMSLRQAGILCMPFSECQPDPTLAQCDRATALLENQGSDFDCVVALGGGSTIDLAKVVALTLRSGRPARDHVACRLDVVPLPLVVLPTTAGTASEITPGAILDAGDGSTKVAVMGNELRATVAVVDPELTLSCPPHVTADAGIDALTHAIESYMTQDSREFDREGDPDPGYSGRTEMTRLFARESIRLCHLHLKAAYDRPADIGARCGMALASLYAGLSYGNAGLHAVHAIAYGVAALTHRSHGTTNAVILPYAMRELANQRTSDLLEIAHIFGRNPPPGNAAAIAREAASAVRELIASVGLPTTLRSMHVTESDLPAIAEAGVAVGRLTKAFPGGNAAQRYPRIVQASFTGSLA